MKKKYKNNSLCENCKEEFYPKSTKSRFCSIRCMSMFNYRKKSETPITIKCQDCGKKFLAQTNVAKFCNECRRRVQQKKDFSVIKNLKKRNCLCCKKEYIPIRHQQKYCSLNCGTIFNSFDFKCQNECLTDSGWIRLRFEVFKRDNFTCQYCGRNVKEDKIKIHCDHIIPKKKGGKDTLENLTTSCSECNLGKGDVLLEYRVKKENR